jgi:putative MATE family efflux protein
MNKENNTTEGVSIILGDPKKAIRNLSGPMIIAMLVTTLYSFIDSIWVAGLGNNALAAVGFVTPLFLIAIGFASGLGSGATAVISRFIGSDSKKDADNTALHVLLLIIIFTLILTFTLWLFLEPILILIGSGSTLDFSLEYGNIIFGGMIFFIFSSAAYGVLRGEGNVKKTTYAMVLSAIINIILDPILIYGLNMGITGAGLSSVIASLVVCILIVYWFKTDTYIDLSFKNFSYSNKIMKMILNVTAPAGVEFLIMATLAGILNSILVIVGGTEAVAVYSAGWRVVMIAIVPMISVGMSLVAVGGANFGARKFDNLNIAENYAIKLGVLIAVVTSILTFIFAPDIASVFAYSPETAELGPLISDFLKIMCLFYLFVPIGVASASIFQGLGKGFHSLFLTFTRELLLIVIFAYILAIHLGLGKEGVWWGIVIGNIIGSLIAYLWSKMFIKRIISTKI